MSRDSSNFLSFLIGGILGAGAALLLAPRTGKETRDQIKEYAHEYEKKLKKQLDEVKDVANDEIKKIKDKAKSAIEEGKRIVKEELKKGDEEEA